MKKYLLVISGLLIAFFLYEYSIYHYGFYLSSYDQNEITAQVTTKGKQIYVNGEPFQVKGVKLSSAFPNYQFSDYELNMQEYLHWLTLIQEMGANTIYVTTIMDNDFYHALYEFNSANPETPLYLYQGVRVSDYGNNTPKDAYDHNFYDVLKDDARTAIDIIHGQKNIILNRGRGYGVYRSDVSQWLLGIQLGDSWNPLTVAYTNNNHNPTSYEGTYVRTTKDATAFEALLASLMDDVLSYEGAKYGQQSLISFSNDPTNDPFVYAPYYAGQLSKYVEIDANHIELSDQAKSGMVAAYHVYDFVPNYATYFSDEQKVKLQEMLNNRDTSRYYEGYTDLLVQYYDIPVLVSDYGYSTARGSDTAERLNEQQQGEALVDTYQDFIASGCVGGVINSWQDEWGLRTWNTTYAVDVNRASLWNDIQSMDHGYGLLAFDSEDDVLVDGKADEWSQEDVVSQTESGTLSMKQDEEGVYFLIQADPSLYEHILIPIDTTSKSGTTTWKDRSLTFSRAADFLVEIQNGDAHVYVQSRYASLRANYSMMYEGVDPYIEPPRVDDPTFVKINMIQKKTKIRENSITAPPMYSDVYETGVLRLGTLDPESDAYDSLSDYAIGEDGIELRIPWQMLNFADPTNLLIHDDYYEHYGVETISISSLYAGLSFNETDVIELKEADLSKWRSVDSVERLKRSYGIVQKAWRDLP